MTDTTKIEKWAFPFKTAGASSAEVSDPQLYYDALAKANSGFYPMGANGLWHGGVHFDAGTGALLEQSSVRCIADGEVIAYRIDERYPTSQYGEGPTAVHLPFSTGFVLVKHRLELPPLPTTAAATSASTAPAAEALTFYSLYMHLRDWAGYRACPTPEIPNFIGEKTYSIKPDKAVDAVKGLKVRAGPKPPAGTPASAEYTTELALLPKGCKIKVGDPASATSQWHKLESILQGAALPALSETQGWVYVGELEATPEPNIYLVGAKANDSNTTLAPQKGLNVRSADKASLLGLLPVGAKFKIAPGTGDYRELKEITEGMDIAPLKANSVGNILGYVHWASLQANLIDPPFDQVVPLNPPIPIKAGELVGHLGQYQNHDGAAQTLLHLEVFSCEDVPAFITKSQARAASLPDSEKTLLQVQPDTKLITHTASMTAANPPKVSDPGSTIGVSRTIPLAVLNNLPVERKIQTSTPMPGGAPIETNWWRLDNAFADTHGNLISGWLADVIPTRHSPWEWQGFDFISETTNASEQFANHLAGQCLLSEAELPDYQAQISTADNGPIKTRLYDIIDGADGTTLDERLSVAEIRAALGKPWHAQSISQLISHYESEWYWQDAKWDALDKLMEHTPATPNTNWVAEKARIKTLAWWDKVAGQHGIKAGGMAWHFHVAGLVGSLAEGNSCIRVEKAQEIALLVTTGFEGASTLDYGALANNFDGQGMSFGIIQWNFGQGTLGPVLQDMRTVNEAVFDACFGNSMNYENLKTALSSGNNTDQKNWAVNIQTTNNLGWKQAFEKIGAHPEFQKIQLKHAAKYHSNVEKCIRMMRELSTELMKTVELRTYVALYDLCVQQNNLEAARATIFSTYPAEHITTQKQLLIFVCTKRAQAANSIWISDCLSRRLGIIQGSTYTSTVNSITKTKANANFSLIIEGTICEL